MLLHWLPWRGRRIRNDASGAVTCGAVISGIVASQADSQGPGTHELDVPGVSSLIARILDDEILCHALAVREQRHRVPSLLIRARLGEPVH